MDKLPKVTIVIPVYNREKYLGIAVDSVLRQTYTDWELIISDDGSTDGTLDLAHNFALHDSRIRVLTAEHKGAAWALIAGFDAAKGEFIGQLDSDDVLEPEAIRLTVKALDEDKECGMVYTNYIDIDENGQKMRPGRRCSIPYSPERMLTEFMTFHFRLIRKSIYDKIGGFNTQFNNIEDYDLCLRLSEVTNIKKIDEFLYLYRFHPDSTKVTMNQLERINLCKEAMTQALQRRGMGNTHEVCVLLNPTFSIQLLEN
jgi:glycosyltransferase involved in cell wall biosynthesis